VIDAYDNGNDVQGNIHGLTGGSSLKFNFGIEWFMGTRIEQSANWLD